MLVVQTHAGRLGRAWHAPDSWLEASAVLERYGADAAPAGGASYLMWRASHGERMPEHLVSLHRIAEGQDLASGSMGALVTLRQLERDSASGAQRALSMAASVAAGPAVRTVATLGGNLASGFRHADLVPALLALDATAHLHGGTWVPVAHVVAHGLDQRLVTRISHDLTASAGWTGATVKLSRRGMDLAVGLASVAVRAHGDMIHEARVAVGSLYERPCRLPAVETALVGVHSRQPAIHEVLSSVDLSGSGFVDDGEATAGYRARIAVPLLEKALTVALRLGVEGRPEPGDARL
jgi:carbon-monoxide dehydrogenase medium subunit